MLVRRGLTDWQRLEWKIYIDTLVQTLDKVLTILAREPILLQIFWQLRRSLKDGKLLAEVIKT